MLFPSLHLQSVYGGTTAQELPEIGHHDPRMDRWTIQGFEAGLSGRFGDHIESYANVHLSYDREESKWFHEIEEWFIKLKELPWGIELRGGRYLNRLGFQNSTHLHGWDFVDSNLVNGLFLGDDGLTTLGVEASWKLPVSWTSQLDISAGRVPISNAHHDEEPLFEGDLLMANWTNQLDYNDFHQFRFGGSVAHGHEADVYAAHLQYQWRENGYESGGRSLRWRTEAMLRDDHFGVASSLIYGFNSQMDVGLRADRVLDRNRLSAVTTYYFNQARTIYLRGQYNYDRSDDFGDEHSVWCQFGFNWGGPEVR